MTDPLSAPAWVECEHQLGQGGISALVPAPGGLRLLAAVLDRLQSFSAAKLQPGGLSPARHRDRITCLVVEPPVSGTTRAARLASADRGGRLVLWRPGRRDAPAPAGERDFGAPIGDLAWAPAGGPGAGHLALALQDGQLVLWHPDTGESRALQTGGEPVLTLDWFPDGAHLLSGGEDGVLQIFRVADGSQAEGGLVRHYNAIRCARVSRCGRWVAFVSQDERGTLFDLERRAATAFGPSGDPVVSLAWHPQRPLLAAGTQGGGALLFDVEAATSIPLAGAAHLHPTETVTWSTSGERLWTAGPDGQIAAFDLSGAQPRLEVVHRPTTRGYGLSVGWLGETGVAAGYSSGQVVLWKPDAKAAWAAQELPGAHSKPVYGLDVAKNGQAVASGAVDRQVKVWDVGSGLKAFDLEEVHKKPVYGVSFSPDGRFVATGSADTYLVVYDTAELVRKSKERFGQDEYWHFTVRNRILNCVAWCPTGGRIAVGLSNHTVVVLPVDGAGRVTKGPTLARHEDSVSGVAWSADGRRLVSAGYDRRLVVWRAEDWSPVAERVTDHQEPIQALAVHPHSNLVVSGSWDGTIRLWSLDGLQPLGVLTRPHFSAVEDLDFSPSGARLASASSDGTIGIWRLRTREEGPA